MVTIELLYIAPDKTTVSLKLTLSLGCTVGDALTTSQLHETHPETRSCVVGIFSKQVSLDTVLRDGDRIELYRPLALDPKEKRRQLARRKK